jgi:hypothetical protein
VREGGSGMTFKPLRSLSHTFSPPLSLSSLLSQVHRIADTCLLSHSPSPQLCALHGGIWDDSIYDLMSSSGGR